MIPWLLAVDLLLSTFLVVLFGWDKAAAKRGGRRIPERILLLFALLGGWPGAWLGATVFRHKTRKLTFRRRLVIATALNVIAMATLLGLWIRG